jgi:hypothetical protein
MALRDGDWRGLVRFGLPSLVVGLCLAWCLEGRNLAAQAQGTNPSPGAAADRSRGTTQAGDGSGTFAFTAPASGNAQLLYLVDTKTKAFAVYRIDPGNAKGTVKLEAARQYQWDLKLSEYNNQEPGVAAIESTVKSLGQSSR